jgi:hypothetical protein
VIHASGRPVRDLPGAAAVAPQFTHRYRAANEARRNSERVSRGAPYQDAGRG